MGESSSTCFRNSEIKNSLEKYTKNCSECLKVPVLLNKNRQVNVQNYEKISNMLALTS